MKARINERPQYSFLYILYILVNFSKLLNDHKLYFNGRLNGLFRLSSSSLFTATALGKQCKQALFFGLSASVRLPLFQAMSRIAKLLIHLWSLAKSLLTQSFSTSGLCVLVASYSMLGAFIFVGLESENESVQHERVKADLRRTLHHVRQDLWLHTVHLNVLYPNEWMNFTGMRLKQYEKELFERFQNEPFYLTSNQWSFSGALLYSITVITTIGKYRRPSFH